VQTPVQTSRIPHVPLRHAGEGSFQVLRLPLFGDAAGAPGRQTRTPMELVEAIEAKLRRRTRRDTAPSNAASEAAERREREAQLVLELPAAGKREHFELREAWVERLRAARSSSDGARRAADELAAHEAFEQAKHDLFRRYGLLD
jgi:hypothetical protein